MAVVAFVHRLHKRLQLLRVSLHVTERNHVHRDVALAQLFPHAHQLANLGLHRAANEQNDAHALVLVLAVLQGEVRDLFGVLEGEVGRARVSGGVRLVKNLRRDLGKNVFYPGSGLNEQEMLELSPTYLHPGREVYGSLHSNAVHRV